MRDLDRARAFYENLGVTVTAQVSTGIFMTPGGGTIFPLLRRSDATPPSHTVAAFQVDDLPGVVASLGGRRVVFEEYDAPGLKTPMGSPIWARIERPGLRTPTATTSACTSPREPDAGSAFTREQVPLHELSGNNLLDSYRPAVTSASFRLQSPSKPA